MILDLTQIGFFVFIFAVLGYIAKYFYDLAYMGFYVPHRKSELENILYYSISGLMIVLFLSWFIIIAYKEGIFGDFFNPVFDMLVLLDKEQIISEDDLKFLLKIFVSFFIFIFYGFILIGGLFLISMVVGLLRRYFSVEGFEINLKNKTILNCRFIYDVNEFLYYIDMEGNWNAIKKENIENFKQKTQPTLFLTKIKKMSKDDWMLLTKSIGYSIIISFFFYTVIHKIDIFSIIFICIGFFLIVSELYLNRKRTP